MAKYRRDRLPLRLALALPKVAEWSATIVWSPAPDRLTWQLRAPSGTLCYLKVAPHGQELTLAAERDRLVWAAPRLTVPAVVEYGVDDEGEWLLTAGLRGVNAVDDRLRANPEDLIPLLAGELRRWHAIPIGDCPFDSRVDGA